MSKELKEASGLIPESELLDIASETDIAGGTSLPCETPIMSAITNVVSQMTSSVCPSSACTSACSSVGICR